MSIYSQILGLASQEQSIQSQQTLAGLHQAQTQQIQQSIAAEAATRDAFRQAQTARDDAAAAQVQQTGTPDQGAGQPKGNGIMALPEIQGYTDRIATRQKDFELYTNMASQIRRSGGDLKLMQQYDDNARQAQEDIAREQQGLLAARKDALGRVASIAGSVTADNWDSTKADLDAALPGWDKGKDVDFDPMQGGAVIWGPRTQRTIASLADQGMTAYQQTEAQWRVAQEARLSAGAEETKRLHDSTIAKDDTQSALNRQKLSYYQAKTETAGAPKKGADPTTKPVKEPTMHEVSDLADDLADQHGLTGAQSRLMASDILARRNEIMTRAPGTSIEDATRQATTEAEKRVTAGTAGGLFSKGTPASYQRLGRNGAGGASTPAQATQTPPTPAKSPTAPDSGSDKTATAVLAPFQAAKIPVEYTGGVLTSKGGGVPMTDALYAKLPSGTVFLGPDGKRYRKP